MKGRIWMYYADSTYASTPEPIFIPESSMMFAQVSSGPVVTYEQFQMIQKEEKRLKKFQKMATAA